MSFNLCSVQLNILDKSCIIKFYIMYIYFHWHWLTWLISFFVHTPNKEIFQKNICLKLFYRHLMRNIPLWNALVALGDQNDIKMCIQISLSFNDKITKKKKGKNMSENKSFFSVRFEYGFFLDIYYWITFSSIIRSVYSFVTCI